MVSVETSKLYRSYGEAILMLCIICVENSGQDRVWAIKEIFFWRSEKCTRKSEIWNKITHNVTHKEVKEENYYELKWFSELCVFFLFL